jgi:predicted phosphodiesterase
MRHFRKGALAPYSSSFLFLISLLCSSFSRKMLPVVSAGYRARSCQGSIRHVHLAVGREPSSQMTISFSSQRSFHVPVIGGVLIGTSPDQLDTYIEEQEPARFYNATPVRAKHGHYHSPYLHHVRVTGLEPSTTYYYKCVVRKQREQPPRPPSPNLRVGTLRGENAEQVLLAEEREIVDDDSFDEEDSGRRRRLALSFYDSTTGECPPPNKIRTFETAPPPGTIGQAAGSSRDLSGGDDKKYPESLKFAYIGDIGQFAHSVENLFHLLTHQKSSVKALMLAGDIAYTQYDNRRWDTYFDFMDDFSFIDEVPLHVCAGNHDIDKQANGTDIFLAYEHRFHMPQVKPAQLGTYQGPPGYLNMDAPTYPLPYEYGNAYYAFTYGISRNIFLNAYSSMEPNSSQYQWLVEELQSVDRSETPWLIVTLHVPLYNAFNVHHHDPQILAAKEHLEPLFVQYKVNMVVSGHIHAYQRTKNVAFGEVNTTGPMYVVVGAGGRQCKASFMSEKPEPWIATRDATRYGYGTLEMFNSTHAQWLWIPTGKSGKNARCCLGVLVGLTFLQTFS